MLSDIIDTCIYTIRHDNEVVVVPTATRLNMRMPLQPGSNLMA